MYKHAWGSYGKVTAQVYGKYTVIHLFHGGRGKIKSKKDGYGTRRQAEKEFNKLKSAYEKKGDRDRFILFAGAIGADGKIQIIDQWGDKSLGKKFHEQDKADRAAKAKKSKRPSRGKLIKDMSEEERRKEQDKWDSRLRMMDDRLRRETLEKQRKSIERAKKKNPVPSIRIGSKFNGWKLSSKSPVTLTIKPLDIRGEVVHNLVVVDPVSGAGKNRVYALYDESGSFTGERIVRPKTEWNSQLDTATKWANRTLGLSRSNPSVPAKKKVAKKNPGGARYDVKTVPSSTKMDEVKRGGHGESLGRLKRTWYYRQTAAGSWMKVGSWANAQALFSGGIARFDNPKRTASRVEKKSKHKRKKGTKGTLSAYARRRPGGGRRNNPAELEGPFTFPNGRVVYYDPGEGKYYDRGTDLYLSESEVESMQSKSKGRAKKNPSRQAGGFYIVDTRIGKVVAGPYSVREADMTLKESAGFDHATHQVMDERYLTDLAFKAKKNPAKKKVAKKKSTRKNPRRNPIKVEGFDASGYARKMKGMSDRQMLNEMMKLDARMRRSPGRSGDPVDTEKLIIIQQEAVNRINKSLGNKPTKLKITRPKRNPKKNPASTPGGYYLITVRPADPRIDPDAFKRPIDRSSSRLTGDKWGYVAHHTTGGPFSNFEASEGDLPTLMDYGYPSSWAASKSAESGVWLAEDGASHAAREMGAVIKRRKSNPKKKVAKKKSDMDRPASDFSVEELLADYDKLKASGKKSPISEMSQKEIEGELAKLERKSARLFRKQGIDPDELQARDVRAAFGSRAYIDDSRRIRFHNPTKRKATKRKATKKKVARKKTPEWQLLCNRCAKLWDHYCERPSKARLKPVLAHLEKMKSSTSKRVADERKACLRVANKEARRLKMK